jgi:hypothetical protein
MKLKVICVDDIRLLLCIFLLFHSVFEWLNGRTQIMKSTGAQFETVNVLENPMLRQGIKEYTNWPTIPQVASPCLPPSLLPPASTIIPLSTYILSFPTFSGCPLPSLSGVPSLVTPPAVHALPVSRVRCCAGLHRWRVHRGVRHRDGDVPVGRAC